MDNLPAPTSPYAAAFRKSYTFDVVMPWERSAGIVGFTDRITVIVDSGVPGGDTGEFEDFIKDSLLQWYDGAWVTFVEETDERDA